MYYGIMKRPVGGTGHYNSGPSDSLCVLYKLSDACNENGNVVDSIYVCYDIMNYTTYFISKSICNKCPYDVNFGVHGKKNKNFKKRNKHNDIDKKHKHIDKKHIPLLNTTRSYKYPKIMNKIQENIKYNEKITYDNSVYGKMLNSYNRWFDTWFMMYKVGKMCGAFMDIFSHYIVDKYVDLRFIHIYMIV